MTSSFLLYDIYYWFTPTLKYYTLQICEYNYYCYIDKIIIYFKYLRYNKFSIEGFKK